MSWQTPTGCSELTRAGASVVICWATIWGWGEDIIAVCMKAKGVQLWDIDKEKVTKVVKCFIISDE